MPAAVSPFTGVEPSAPNDDLDGLFDDLLGDDSNGAARSAANGPSNQSNDIDEEVKIVKKRKPVAKLDENRLLSAAGIPKLRKISKKNFKFNGKGNEFTDMAKLLNTYQLWLDDLFPKAKFLDGLAMVEKLGHKKKIQIYRKEWIDEGKPRGFEDELDDFVASQNQQASEQRQEEVLDPLRDGPEEQERNQQEDLPHIYDRPVEQNSHQEDGEPDEDELAALQAETPTEHRHTFGNGSAPQQEDIEPDEDELDALLAEDAMAGAEQRSVPVRPNPAGQTLNVEPLDDFAEEEEEAMAGMEW